MAEMVRLLVVCLGNICRSPMAEGILRHRIAASPLDGRIELDSAGTGDWHVGRPPDPRAIATAARHGVDISGLRGRQLVVRDFGYYDWLLCADRSNLRDVQALAPGDARARSGLLLEWAGMHGGDREIPDPYASGSECFEHVWRLLEEAAEGVVARLLRDRG